MAKKKTPKWKIKKDLEAKLKILFPKKYKVIPILIQIFLIGMEKGGVKSNPIIKTKTVCDGKRYNPSTVSGFFRSWLSGDSPILREIEDGNKYDPEFTYAFIHENAHGVIMDDIRIYYKLYKNNLLGNSELDQVKKLHETLDKFYGL